MQSTGGAPLGTFMEYDKDPSATLSSDVDSQADSWLTKLGPGLITGAADDDPSGIATYSQAGAQFGFDMLWTVLLTYPLMVAIQVVSARIGRVSGHGLATNLRRHYPRWLLYGTVILLLVANTINIAADLTAMGAAVNLLVGGPTRAYTVVLGVFSLVLQMFVPYRRYVRILKWLTLALFAYVGVIFAVQIPWATVALRTVLPHGSWSTGYITTVVAVFGTTISPYLFFWQASQEVEELQAKEGQQALTKMPSQGPENLSRIRLDTSIGMAFSNLVAFSSFSRLRSRCMRTISPISRRRRRPPPRETDRRAVCVPALQSRHHRHGAARAAGAGRVGGLRDGRHVQVEKQPRARAATGETVLRDHRARDRRGPRARFHVDRPDQGAVLERGHQRRHVGTDHGADDADGVEPKGHGRLRHARAAAVGGMAFNRCDGRRRDRDVRFHLSIGSDRSFSRPGTAPYRLRIPAPRIVATRSPLRCTGRSA